MASKRHLKKNIQAITSDLVNYLYIKRSFLNELSDEKFYEALQKIVAINNEFLSRSNRPKGKNNSKTIKTYYKQLIADFNAQINEVLSIVDETVKDEKKK